MSLIKVDAGKCLNDGICVESCPVSILRLDSHGLPRVLPRAGQFCIGCGHCVAACPTGALDNVRNPLERHLPMLEKPIPSEMVLTFLKSRRSVRRFKEEKVSRQLLLELLGSTRHAPSGHNSQGVSFLVVDERESIMKISSMVIDWMRGLVEASSPDAADFHMAGIIKSYEKGADKILRDAPAVIVATAPVALGAAQVTTYLKLEYLELYASALGLGTCWAGFAQACARQFPPLAEYLGIPQGEGVTGMMMVGHPKFGYHRIPDRAPLQVRWHDGQEG